MQFNKNADFSLTKFIAFVILTVGVPVGVFFGARTKAVGNWFAQADMTWLIILVAALIVALAFGWAIETHNSRQWHYLTTVLALIAGLVLALNWSTIAKAFTTTNWAASVIILGFVALMVFVGRWMATNTKKKEDNNTPEGGAS